MIGVKAAERVAIKGFDGFVAVDIASDYWKLEWRCTAPPGDLPTLSLEPKPELGVYTCR